MPRHDTDWLDAQYNNRARIPEHAALFERWGQASALARQRLSRRLDIAYGSEAGETLDLFPSARDKAPILVFLHGGYWRSLDKRDHSFVAPAFVNGGAMVVVPNYALCPSVTIPQIVMQTVRALAWTWRHARLYGGDPRRIVLVGHSAGGHLAAMMLTCLWKKVASDLPADLVRGALSISGLYDLETVARVPFLNSDLKLTPASARRVSPALFPPPGVPLLAVAGAQESEEFLRQNALIRQAWGRRAVPVCETVPGTHHLNVLHDLADPATRLHALARGLLEDSAKSVNAR